MESPLSTTKKTAHFGRFFVLLTFGSQKRVLLEGNGLWIIAFLDKKRPHLVGCGRCGVNIVDYLTAILSIRFWWRPPSKVVLKNSSII